MGRSIETKCCVGTIALWMLLSTTTSHAQENLSNDPLFVETCGDVSDGAEVRIFAQPVTAFARIGGTSIDPCKATGLFVKLVEGGAKKGKGEPIEENQDGNQNSGKKDDTARQEDEVDCADPDVVMAMLSATIPDTENVCDITEAYLSFFEDNEDFELEASLLCFPPPYFCKATPAGRRLMQSTAESGESTESSSEESSSNTSDKSNAVSTPVQTAESETSEGSGGSRRSRRSRQLSRLPEIAAITACRGDCCITTVVTGGMFKRLLNLVSKESCPGFGKPR